MRRYACTPPRHPLILHCQRLPTMTTKATRRTRRMNPLALSTCLSSRWSRASPGPTASVHATASTPTIHLDLLPRHSSNSVSVFSGLVMHSPSLNYEPSLPPTTTTTSPTLCRSLALNKPRIIPNGSTPVRWRGVEPVPTVPAHM